MNGIFKWRIEAIFLVVGVYTICQVVYLTGIIEESGNINKELVNVLRRNAGTPISIRRAAVLSIIASNDSIQNRPIPKVPVTAAEYPIISEPVNNSIEAVSVGKVRSASTESLNTSSKTHKITNASIKVETNRTCQPPGMIHYGISWPNCAAKLQWLKNNWKKDKCYAQLGVTDDQCSMLEYLSGKEKHCPLLDYQRPKLEEPYFEGLPPRPREDFTELYNKLGNLDDYAWIKKRIKSMENMWIENSKLVFTKSSTPRLKKRIHLHLGLLSLGLGKDAFKGGPLGELVQWSDLISALYVMGHDLIITRARSELSVLYQEYRKPRKSACPSIDTILKAPFDIIYTDIRGFKEMQRFISQFGQLRCRVRILDSFGTEAAFNHPSYQQKKRLRKSEYSGLNIKLQQFNTMFPHTQDNTFLGFVTEFAKQKINTTSTKKRDIALVYGKDENFWNGKEKYIDTIKEYVSEVHSTVHAPKQLRPYIINHGIVNSTVLASLLQRTKIFVGLGFPFEGPAPLEAIQSGAVFLNPFFPVPFSSVNNAFYKTKPTRRKITSQNPYAEKYIGRPHVYTVDIDDEKALKSALHEIVNSPDPGSFLSHEFSVRGMLERVSVQVEKQQFCVHVPYSQNNGNDVEDLRWPPFSALKAILAPTPGKESCNEVCANVGLLCEPSFFPILNRQGAFLNLGLNCDKTEIPTIEDIDYPAYDKTKKICYLQKNQMLFSCADNYKNMQRLCPCRDYKRTQVALCSECGLN